MEDDLLCGGLADVHHRQSLAVPRGDLTALPRAQLETCAAIFVSWSGSSEGGHPRPPRCWLVAAGRRLIAVRRDERAGAGGVADWPVATPPTDCVEALSKAGGSAGKRRGFGRDDGHGT